MKKKFKKGDMVRIIGGNFEFKDLTGYEATVVYVASCGLIDVVLINNADKNWHCFNSYNLEKIK